MDQIYYNPKSSGGYGGIQRVSRAARGKKTQKQVRDYLSRQVTYQLHKPRRIKFKRRQYQVSEIDDLWQSDLADMQSLKGENDGYAYIVVVIDVFSKFLFVRAIRSKTECLEALKSVIEESGRKPRNMMTDKGTEFVNEESRRYYRDIGVNYYTAENAETKAAVAERVIRTLKGRIYKYMTRMETRRYIDVLQDFVTSYNGSVHRTIGMRPRDVDDRSAQKIRQKMMGPLRLVEPKFRFQLHDDVRIAIYPARFSKGYVPQWSTEIFQITKRKKTLPPTYKLKDRAGEPITGSFYEPELQLVPERRSPELGPAIAARHDTDDDDSREGSPEL